MNYPQDFVNKIINDDCLKVLKEIPDKCIDLVLTDPPYFLDWKEPLKFKDRKDVYHHKQTTELWDTTSNVTTYYNNLFLQFEKILKQSGNILTFCKVENLSYLKQSALKNNLKFKATIIWHKTNPMIQIRKKNYVSSFETLVWLAKHNENNITTFNFGLQKNMHNFIELPICMGNERSEHPTQKPLKLIKHFIKIHSNKNDIILDPFVGSGTTAVACKLLNRQFIGIEKEEKYCKIAEDRLKKTIDTNKTNLGNFLK